MNLIRPTPNLTSTEPPEDKSSIESKLDEVLEYIDAFKIMSYPDRTDGVTHPTSGLMASIKLEAKSFLELLMILKEADYIILDFDGPEANPQKIVVRSKIKGELFIKQGGYVQRLERMNQEKKYIKDLQDRQLELDENAGELSSRMVRLTRWIFFVTSIAAVYYIDELCKSHQWLWYSPY